MSNPVVGNSRPISYGALNKHNRVPSGNSDASVSRSSYNEEESPKYKSLADMEDFPVSNKPNNNGTEEIKSSYVSFPSSRFSVSGLCSNMADLFDRSLSARVNGFISSAYEHKGKVLCGFIAGVGVGLGIMYSIMNADKGSPNPLADSCQGMDMQVVAGLAHQIMRNTTAMVNSFIRSHGATELKLANVTGCVAEVYPELALVLNLAIQGAIDSVKF